MKIELEPSAYHARRARRGARVVIRCRKGVFDCYPMPDLPPSNTPEQQAVRAIGKATVEAWRGLTVEQKAAWSELGRRVERIFPRRSVEPLTGYRLFQSCARYRQILGLPIHADPQGFPPPESVTGIGLLPSADPRTFRFRVHHTAKAPAGYRLIVSISPSTGRRGRKADRRNGRHIKGFGPASTVALPASGGVVEFTGARFTVRPGERFGMWVRIVHEHTGSAGPEFFADLTRPEMPAESLSDTEAGGPDEAAPQSGQSPAAGHGQPGGQSGLSNRTGHSGQGTTAAGREITPNHLAHSPVPFTPSDDPRPILP